MQNKVVEEVAEEELPAPIMEDIESSSTIEQQPSSEEMDNIEDSCYEEIEELDVELDFTECQQFTKFAIKKDIKHMERERLRILLENAWYLVEKIITCKDAHAITVVNRSIENTCWKLMVGNHNLIECIY